ncbi:dipeptide epimerase, partial [Bacillus thuringiensis]|nr:dipeptide epimerase [Bacillus thuringiensis]
CLVVRMMESSRSVSALAHLAEAHPKIHYFDLDAPLWLVEEPAEMTYSEPTVKLQSTVTRRS